MYMGFVLGTSPILILKKAYMVCLYRSIDEYMGFTVKLYKKDTAGNQPTEYY